MRWDCWVLQDQLSLACAQVKPEKPKSGQVRRAVLHSIMKHEAVSNNHNWSRDLGLTLVLSMQATLAASHLFRCFLFPWAFFFFPPSRQCPSTAATTYASSCYRGQLLLLIRLTRTTW